MGRLDGALHEVPREAAELQVHLEARDALLRAAHLEVHVAAVVLGAEDVGDEHLLRLVVVGEEADRDAGHRALQGHARVHEGEAAVADGRHRRGAVGAHDLADDADRIREVIRKNLRDGALGERAVADLAAAGGAEAAHFARAVRREVVVEDEALARGAARHGVELLGVLLRAERDRGERLGLAAREDRRAVDARKHAHLGRERTNLVLGTAVDAEALLEHVLADGLDLEGVEEVHEADGVDLGPLLAHLLEEVLLDGGDLALALELALDEQRGREGLAALRADEVHLVLRLRHVVDVLVGLAEGAAHLDLEVDDLLDFLMGALERGEEVLVAHLGGGALHHEELAADAGVEEVDVAPRLLVVRGVDHPLAVHASRVPSLWMSIELTCTSL